MPKDNPLDPDSEGGIDAPIRVSGITVSRPVSGHVNISWDQTPEANGYYIYRSESYYGEYVLLTTIDEIIITEFDDYNYISGTFYYYILSAYKTINGENLEGYRSDKFYWK